MVSIWSSMRRTEGSAIGRNVTWVKKLEHEAFKSLKAFFNLKIRVKTPY